VIKILFKLRKRHLINGDAAPELIEGLLFFSEVTYVGRLRNRKKFDYQIEVNIPDPKKINEWVEKNLRKFILTYDFEYPQALAA
jgi:hypothetical protein